MVFERSVRALRRARGPVVALWVWLLLAAVYVSGALTAAAAAQPAAAALWAIVALLALAGLGLLIVLWLGRPAVPARAILELDLSEGVAEHIPDHPLARMTMGRRPLLLRRLVEALERGAEDDRVVGLVARVDGNLGLAQMQEIRDAVAAFREHGKPAVAYAETFGEFASGNLSYYLATAFEEIFLQPSGDVGLTGLAAESPFVRGILDKLDVTPRLDHRREYKTAMNLLTERAYTDAHREAVTRVIETQFAQMVAGIAAGRGLDEERVRELVDRGPLLGGEAVEAGLIDGLAYRDEVHRRMRDRWAGKAALLYLTEYLRRTRPTHRKARTVALIYGVGGVRRGRSGFDPRLGGVVMGSDTVTAAFRSAIEERRVEAILFRVDSPGGSYVASDAIWREVVRAREAGKPVVVSMGNVAGSGGYFVAMGADAIVAQPGTITGSIGVVGGKLLTSQLWEKLGVTWDEVHRGENATMWSARSDYTPQQWDRFQAWLDRVYQDFTAKVAEGRGLAEEQVLELARGRIWSGQDAKDLGLVDELGGLTRALGLAREAAAIPETARVRLEDFPRRRPAWRRLGRRPASSEEEGVGQLAWQAIGPLARALGPLGLSDDQRVLAMPWV
ncbi:MAG: signal peptide peptidase SppA [Acidimicrobiia bacterium]